MRNLFLLLLLYSLLISCDPYVNPLNRETSSNEILIYSGMTMADAIFELKDKFESANDCEVKVMYGASGYLQKVIEVNRKGDIFFPGNISYLNKFKENRLITRVSNIGYNSLAFFVAKDNPLALSGELDQLIDPRLKIVMGSAEAGSVGEETVKLLKSSGLYDKVLENTRSFTTDSKGLAISLRSGEADLVVNWRAVGYTKKNHPYMTKIDINSDKVVKVPIAMGLLKYSVDSVCANEFLDFAESAFGRRIFQRYGFID